VLSTAHAARRLRHRGFNQALGLPTWSEHTMTKEQTMLTITSSPGRRAPGWTRRLLPLVMGSMLEFGTIDSPRQRCLYVSGDNLVDRGTRGDSACSAAIEVGVLQLGGTRLPAGARLPFWLTVTLDGVAGAAAVQIFDLAKVIPVHFDDYGIFASPLSEFTQEMTRRALSDRIVNVWRGETVQL
jgi:hypothetical protein